jgi:Chaperone of endosialidase/Secretion system C-terminal sorting domain
MKHISTRRLLLASAVSIALTTPASAQVFIRTGSALNFTLPVAPAPEQFRVTNGLISHYVAGTVGSFGATDQWIGVGNPLSSLYGLRTQWNGQAFIQALRTRSATDLTKDAIIEWGNAGGELRFRYISNPLSPTAVRNVLVFDTSGNALFGIARNNAFQIPKLEVNTTGGPNAFIASSTNATLGAAQFNAISNSSSFSTNQYGIRVRATGTPGGLFLNNGIDVEANAPRTNLAAGNPVENTGIRTNAVGANATNRGVFATASGNGTGTVNYGVFATTAASVASNAPTTYSLYGISSFFDNGASSNVYGVFGQVTGSVSATNYNAYGVYGRASLAPNSTVFTAAGYFEGDLYVTGNAFFLSDGSLKKEVKTESGMLSKIRQLRPVNYFFNKEDNKYMSLPSSLQHGFIAQELEKVFPEMVGTAQQPEFDENGRVVKSRSLKAVNYTMLIPVLTEAIKEQQAAIDEQAQTISELKNEMLQLKKQLGIKNGSGAITSSNDDLLSQNTPNPFSGTTVIRYNIPADAKNAVLAVFDMNGKMLLQFNNLSGRSQITINGNTLAAGMYIYSLLVNGQELATRRMILTK